MFKNRILLLTIISIIGLLFLLKKLVIVENYTNSNSKKQLNFKKTLEDMANILKKNKIPFHLHSGTALGAIREKRFIPHDKDIDIAIFNKDKVNNLDKIILKENIFSLVHKLPLNSKYSDIMEMSFVHKGTNVKIDIFFILEENDKYRIFSYFGICDTKPNKRCEYVNSKYKLNDIIFFNKNYKVPEIKFLEEQYGKDWKISKNISYEEALVSNGYKNMI